MMVRFHAGGASLVRLGEIVMILELHRQGVSVSAIARQVGLDRKTVHKYIERGLEPPVYGPRPPRASKIAPFARYLRERLAAFPQLTGRRLHRELRELGYTGGYSILTDFLREIRPTEPAPFEVRFETPPGRQAQVDFAHFRTVFTDEPGMERIVWLFSLVLGHSRMLWARFVLHQDLPTLLRCHAAAFEALGGVPEHILYDRMRTVFSREDPEAGHIVYNRTLLEFARHYGYLPKACKPYRAKTKGKVERPFRYIREDFFLGRSFRNLDDLNAAIASSGSTRWPMCACMPRPGASSPSISPRSARSFSSCLPDRSRPCCASSAASPATAWSRSTATSTACRTARAAASSRCTTPPTRCAFSRRATSLPSIPSWMDAASGASSPVTAACRLRPTARRPRNGASGRARSGDVVALRPLAFYDAVGRRLAANGAAA